MFKNSEDPRLVMTCQEPDFSVSAFYNIFLLPVSSVIGRYHMLGGSMGKYHESSLRVRCIIHGMYNTYHEIHTYIHTIHTTEIFGNDIWLWIGYCNTLVQR